MKKQYSDVSYIGPINDRHKNFSVGTHLPFRLNIR